MFSIVQIPKPAIKIDFIQYKKHRYRVANAKPKVDNKAPPIDLSVYYDQDKLLILARRTKTIFSENLHIVKKMNKVFRVGVS